MARSISVKVPTALLIAQIEERIAQIDKDIAEYPARRAAYEKASEAYNKEVAGFMADYVVKNHKQIRTGYDADLLRLQSYGNRVELTFFIDAIPDFPVRPVAPASPNQNESFGREYTTRKTLLEKNLRILKMTSQEEVNASTYGAIMEII
jgi:hypothetical protein